jgi:hypothetical protein
MTNTYTTTIRWRACRNPNGTYIHIDTAEAAIAWAKRHDDPTIHGFDHYHRLRETLNHYTTNK